MLLTVKHKQVIRIWRREEPLCFWIHNWVSRCACFPIFFANMLPSALFGVSDSKTQAAFKDYRAEPIWFYCSHQQLGHPESSEEASCHLAVSTSVSIQVIWGRQWLTVHVSREAYIHFYDMWKLQSLHIEMAGVFTTCWIYAMQKCQRSHMLNLQLPERFQDTQHVHHFAKPCWYPA